MDTTPNRLAFLAFLLVACSGKDSRDSAHPGTTDPIDTAPPLSAPTADAGPDLVGPIGTALDFDGSASTGVSYLWDFGDGTTADTPTASHTYTHPGNYTAVLQVTGEDGSKQSDQVRVTAHRPIADTPAVWSAMMQITPDGSTLWAAVDDGTTVARIDTTTFAVDHFPVGGPIRGLALSGDTVGVSVGSRNALVILEQATGGERYSYTFDAHLAPGHVVGGDHFTVALTSTGQVADIDRTGALLDTTDVGADPRALARTPAGELLVSRWRSPDETARIYRPAGDDIVFALKQRASRIEDGWMISDVTGGKAVARLLLPGERSPYGGQDLVADEERWKLFRGRRYWVKVSRYRKTPGQLPVYRAKRLPAPASEALVGRLPAPPPVEKAPKSPAKTEE